MLGSDGNDEELARVTIPFWMIRMAPGKIAVSSSDQKRSVRFALRADELEGYGPTLLPRRALNSCAPSELEERTDP